LLHADWTLGCVGLADRDIAELYDVVDLDVKVEVVPETKK
jgi:hypothetical protein